LRSIRSCSPARTTSRATGQGGFALLWAIGLAVLFFMLIELMLIDSARELREAQRFRARIVAAVLAENGAELAAHRIVDNIAHNPEQTDWQGTITGQMSKNPLSGDFRIIGTGRTAGTVPTTARVELKGRVDMTAPGAPQLQIFFSTHTP
jgi:hypothetical protein